MSRGYLCSPFAGAENRPAVLPDCVRKQPGLSLHLFDLYEPGGVMPRPMSPTEVLGCICRPDPHTYAAGPKLEKEAVARFMQAPITAPPWK